MEPTALKVSGVSFQYEKDIPVLEDITFTASPQESIGLIGANGVGKSTLLKLIVGLLPCTKGAVYVGDMQVKKETLPQVRERTGYVFQDSESQLFSATVYDDVAFAPRSCGLPEEEITYRTRQALDMIHIGHLRDKPIYKLSGGEKKMVSIATILSMLPDLILMDEPSIALDPGNRRNLIRVLNSLSQTKLIATHDLDLVLDTCTRTILMSHGRVIADGDAKEILTDRRLLEANGLELPFCLQKHSLNGLQAAHQSLL